MKNVITMIVSETDPLDFELAVNGTPIHQPVEVEFRDPAYRSGETHSLTLLRDRLVLSTPPDAPSRPFRVRISIAADVECVQRAEEAP